MKRLIEILSWMALFFVLVFAFVEYTKHNTGPLPPISRFNSDLRDYSEGRFLDARRRPIKVTWSFLRKTQDGLVAEALAALDPKKAKPVLGLLNDIVKTRDPESHAAILAANMQVQTLLSDANLELPSDIKEINVAVAISALKLIDADPEKARNALLPLVGEGLLSLEYLRRLLPDQQ